MASLKAHGTFRDTVFNKRLLELRDKDMDGRVHGGTPKSPSTRESVITIENDLNVKLSYFTEVIVSWLGRLAECVSNVLPTD